MSTRTHKKVVREDDDYSAQFFDEEEEESEEKRSEDESQAWQPNDAKAESSSGYSTQGVDFEADEPNEENKDQESAEEEEKAEKQSEKKSKARKEKGKKVNKKATESKTKSENFDINSKKDDVKAPLKEVVDVSPKKKFKVPSAVKKDSAGRKELISKKLAK